MKLEDIIPGQSYACKYQDLQGPALAIIVKRDVEHRRVQIRDVDTGHTMTLSWDDVWDVDEVEWHE